jgi:hypothetical protein
MRKVEGYPNYDQSVFGESSPIAKTDEEILKIMNSQYNLNEFVDRKNFKTYDELARKLDSVLNPGGTGIKPAAQRSDDAQQTREVKKPEVRIMPQSTDDDDEDAMAFFKKIATDEDDDIPF